MDQNSKPTQAQRREATRKALLEATIRSLISEGYADTTTRGIAQRASVSQGALQHHFSNKLELVKAAVDYAMQKLAGQGMDSVLAIQGTEKQRLELIVDLLWQAHQQPMTQAVFELFLLSRNEPDIADHVASVLESATQYAHKHIALALPSYASQPGFFEWLKITEAMMRGATLLDAIPLSEDTAIDWPQIRQQVLKGFERLAINH